MVIINKINNNNKNKYMLGDLVGYVFIFYIIERKIDYD